MHAGRLEKPRARAARDRLDRRRHAQRRREPDLQRDRCILRQERPELRARRTRNRRARRARRIRRVQFRPAARKRRVPHRYAQVAPGVHKPALKMDGRAETRNLAAARRKRARFDQQRALAYQNRISGRVAPKECRHLLRRVHARRNLNLKVRCRNVRARPSRLARCHPKRQPRDQTPPRHKLQLLRPDHKLPRKLARSQRANKPRDAVARIRCQQGQRNRRIGAQSRHRRIGALSRHHRAGAGRAARLKNHVGPRISRRCRVEAHARHSRSRVAEQKMQVAAGILERVLKCRDERERRG